MAAPDSSIVSGAVVAELDPTCSDSSAVVPVFGMPPPSAVDELSGAAGSSGAVPVSVAGVVAPDPFISSFDMADVESVPGVECESVPDVDCESVFESPAVDDPDPPLDESESERDVPDDVLSDEGPSVDRSVDLRSDDAWPDDAWSEESELDDVDESPTDGAATAMPAGATASPMPSATASSPRCLRCWSLFMSCTSLRTLRTAVRNPGCMR